MTQKTTSIFFLVVLLGTGLPSGLLPAQEKLPIGKNGKTAYAILVDPSAPESVRKAAGALQHYLQKAANLSPRLVTDRAVPAGPFISVGRTAALKAAGLDTAGIVNDGFRIVTKGKNLYIYGPDTPTGAVNASGGVSHGTANGVYTFLEDYVGVRWLMPGEAGEYIPEITTLAIPALDRTESSPFDYRDEHYLGIGPAVEEWAGRLKLAKVADLRYNHAWQYTIPASAYAQHPTWFASINGKHLPPADRYKLETTNPELVQAYADAVMAAFRKDPNLKWYSLSPSDGIAGESDWSNSPEAEALLEKDPSGKVSRTRLVLKFYNDVAKIVGKQFPDHKLGGYIYANYLYPPKGGIPKLEPNLALMLATNISYGYQLYRPATQKNWEYLVKTWGEASKRDGFDIYYYDLPTAIMQHNGTIMPPAPDILNFIFPRLLQYGFKGAYVYGRPVWPVFGASNYAIARMKWNPKLDANNILREYYGKAYGSAAAPHIAQLYAVLDTAYRAYMNRHPEANYSLSPDHLKEIYAPCYRQLEKHYLDAWAAKAKDAGQRRRLELFGQVLSLMQYNLRSLALLPPDYQSALTRSDAEVDKILTETDPTDLKVTALSSGFFLPTGKSLSVKTVSTAGTGSAVRTPAVPVLGAVRLLLHVPASGEVTVNVKSLNTLGEFIRYSLTDAAANPISAGAVREGRTIAFTGEAGKTYLMDIPTRKSPMQLEVTGAAVAYKANRDSVRYIDGFRIEAHDIAGATLPLYFYVPEHVKDFGVTMSFARGIVADVYTPGGKKAGQLNTTETAASRFTPDERGFEPGFWKVVVHKPAGADPKTVSLTLDQRLPQWFIPEANQALMIR